MNKDIFEGNWEEIKGKMKQQWGKLTDDDFKEIEGTQQEVFGKLQKHYGYSKEEAEKAVKDFKDASRR
ncbi:MAG: CsbD family protein [Tatlockia sp.]|nr:CsbD family protein [Tatlockia sp.]